MFDFSDIPQILDPILDFLHEKLPPKLYSCLLTFIAQSLALISALFTLTVSLLSSKPWEWDAQTIIPPIITVLAAYLTLLSVYRTANWMIRTTFFFIKWGTILGALFTGAGWYMGNQGGDGAGRGLVATLGGYVLDVLNEQSRNNAAFAQSRPKPSTSRARKNNQKRPSSWESFDKHQEWQYQEEHGERKQDDDVKKIMYDIAETASRILAESGWWGAAKAPFGGEEHVDERHGRMEDTPTR